MKKSIHIITKTITSIILSASIVFGSIPSHVLAATDSAFDTLYRVYDADSDGLLHSYFVDESGNAVDLKSSGSSSKVSFKKSANLPSSYDLRTVNAVSAIKNQGITGCCWAFAALKAMESNLAIKGIETIENLDLSESHLAWYTYHPSTTASDLLYDEGFSYHTPFFGSSDEYNEGGNASLAAFTLARWSGAVTEDTAPFNGNTQSDIDNMIRTMKDSNDALRYSNNYILTDSVCYDSATLEQIKKVLMTDGAMDLSYYHMGDFFNNDTNAYYQEHLRGKLAIENANHSVNIIGWDDNYPKENFSPYQPSSDGAWLIANSYGDDFGDHGYSWISYEEPSLTEFYTYCAVSSDAYDNNYQYDGFGWSSSVADKNATTTTGANIYTANSDYNQELTAVGIYTLVDNQPFTIRIYRGVSANAPTSGTLATTITGTKEFQGYHTIPLENAVTLNGGERFSVVISYDRGQNNTGYIPVEGSGERDFECEISYHSNAGESFLYDSSNAKWIDTSIQQARGTLRNNICIKAFTKNTTIADPVSTDSNNENTEPDNTQNKENDSSDDNFGDTDDPNYGYNEIPATVKFVKETVTLGVGENYSPLILLANAASQKISYESSDSSIATVNNTGQVTAKATGTAKIVVSLSSGASAKLTITVKKAPDNLTIKPANKKTITKKKSFQIKVKLPEGSASNHITYSSSKPSIAKVNANGKVTGKKKGKAIITVKTYNGVTAKLTVRVKAK